MTMLSQSPSLPQTGRTGPLSLPRPGKWEWAALAAIVLLAGLLRFTNLDSLGYANHYYTAAVESMLQSWHNFFYVAAEPGGSVSVDKPPVGLWLQAISAHFFGVNGFAVLLPQLLAGMASILVLYHLVRRSFGGPAGLLAALTLAVTPIVVATDRNNTIDSTLILTLLLAAWAFIKATETGRLRYLMLGALLAGIGFNIKMLQAYLPLPAFYALYFLGAREGLWRKAGKLLLASALLLAVSLSWAVAVDLTPADQRPYVGSSTDNSETNLILVYNGLDRLVGMFGRRGVGPMSATLGRPQPPSGMPFNGPFQNGSNANPFPQGPNGGFPGPQDGANPPRGSIGPRFSGRGGFLDTGERSALRLFVPPLSKETSWLLPFGLACIALIAASRWTWPIGPEHRALVLWGGWLVTCVIFFSVAGFFHEYYLSMLGAPLAALMGIGADRLWTMAKDRPRLSVGLLSATATGTLLFQAYTANSFTRTLWWLPVAALLLLTGIGLLLSAAIRRARDERYPLGFGLVLAALLVTPAVWSALTNMSASQNQSLPSAYSGGAVGPVAGRDVQVNPSLLDYLETNTENVKYLLAVPSAMQGTDYVLATGRPVLYMGGFMGQDQVVSADELSRMVSDGELRYVYWNSEGPGRGNNREVASWISSACTPVQGFDTATRNAGAPDGTNAASEGMTTALPFNRNFRMAGGPAGSLLITLYDCAAGSNR